MVDLLRGGFVAWRICCVADLLRGGFVAWRICWTSREGLHALEEKLGGAEAKTILPKKEKMKLRREQWLQKIEAIKLAEQKHREERRRRATVVVGDLHPLRDALPELLGLKASSRRQAHRESNKPRPSELSRMSTAQRQQLLEEERTRFRELLASPAYRARPLVAIGQTLARQMQLEGGGQL
ncbi:ribosome biogenesis protein SLX9 homolog isoform X6 [Macaca fascicularis]|uniref:ribosome biogenesis protein SLX9 homolog isoform X6 n=1 Tax=Macaca fascicularis TaxID=9541 RepID=UPI003D15B20C